MFDNEDYKFYKTSLDLAYKRFIEGDETGEWFIEKLQDLILEFSVRLAHDFTGFMPDKKELYEQ